MKEIFTIFDKHRCAVDMVSTSEVSVSLTVDSNDNLPALAADLGQLADVKYEGRKALICMVGDDIRGQNGMAAQVFSAIRHINVRMISQGASEINMSFMIDEDDADEAVRSLHAAFFQDPDPSIFDVEARLAAQDDRAFGLPLRLRVSPSPRLPTAPAMALRVASNLSSFSGPVQQVPRFPRFLAPPVPPFRRLFGSPRIRHPPVIPLPRLRASPNPASTAGSMMTPRLVSNFASSVLGRG